MKKRMTKLAALLLALAMLLSTSAFAAEEIVTAELLQIPEITEPIVPQEDSDDTPGFVTRGSNYIDCSSLAVHSTGGGGLDIAFSITGTHTMDSIGAYWIDLYRGSNTSSGTRVASFLYTDSGYSYLMTTNTVYHDGIIHYEGATTGSCYYAVAMYYAGYGGGGDFYRHVSTVSQA